MTGTHAGPSNPVIVVSGHSFRDPLFSALIYRYLRAVIEARPASSFVLITEEQGQYAMSPGEVEETKARLESEGITWRPLSYRSGRLLVLKKLLHFAHLLAVCAVVRIRRRPSAILGFLAVAGGYAYVLSLLLRLRLIVFCFEPHSRYMTDFGVWPRHSLRAKLLGAVEFLQATRCDHLVVPTVHTEALVRGWRTRARLYRVPICIDTSRFAHSARERIRARRSLGIGERYCLVYAGKFGGAYCSANEVGLLCAALSEQISDLFTLVITPNDVTEVGAAFHDCGLTPERATVLAEVPPDALPSYLSAADIGLLAIPPLPSQRYRTPVKTGIYLSMGLPVILNRGVSDDDDLVATEGVGVVMAGSIAATAASIRSLREEDPDQLRERCRQVASRHKDAGRAVGVLGRILEDLEG